MTTNTTTRGTVRLSYRVAIRAKFHGNTRRISVTHGSGAPRLYFGWNDALDTAENYAYVIQAYLNHMEWDGQWVIGSDTDGYYAVWAGA